jgi:hypothetical protein
VKLLSRLLLALTVKHQCERVGLSNILRSWRASDSIDGVKRSEGLAQHHIGT